MEGFLITRYLLNQRLYSRIKGKMEQNQHWPFILVVFTLKEKMSQITTEIKGL